MQSRAAVGFALGAFMMLVPSGATAAKMPFTEAGIRVILAHGPWPAPAP